MTAAAQQHHRAFVRSSYRQLLRLARRLPADKAAAARSEAAATLRERRSEADPELSLRHAKELAARVSFLRMTTPRPAGEPIGGEGAGRFVLRDGEWQRGEGEGKGER